MIDREWRKDYTGNSIKLWTRKLVTSLLYYRGYRKLYPHKPWYTPGAIRFLEKKIPQIKNVFEFGAGNSSIWYAERVREYIAVEHDPTWYDYVYKKLKNGGHTHAKIHLITTDENAAKYDWEKMWPHYATLKHPPANPEFKEYMSKIDQYPDGSFDCIVIDGRERLGCLLHALPKLSKKGLIIFDDSARDKFQEAFSILHDWPNITFRFGLGQTTFFSKNEDLLSNL